MFFSRLPWFPVRLSYPPGRRPGVGAAPALPIRGEVGAVNFFKVRAVLLDA